MIHNIRAELIKILDESDWMDDETKVVAKEKVMNLILYLVFNNDCTPFTAETSKRLAKLVL